MREAEAVERAVDNGAIFSVVTVCLNPEEKLNITLDSILKQSFEGLEVILKDGGSEDGECFPSGGRKGQNFCGERRGYL